MDIVGKAVKRAARRVKKTAGAAFGVEKCRDLRLWQERLEKARQAARPELDLMDWREDLYAGTREIRKGANSAAAGPAKKASTVRNIVCELIEAQIDSNLPKPRVDPTDPADEARSLVIERMLRSDIDRLPVEYLNDEQERTNPIQGGSWVLVEWDNTLRTHTTVGDTVLTLLHPKQVFLQPGVRDVKKSKYAICQFAVSKDYVLERFGVDVSDEKEEKPEIGVASGTNAPPAGTDNVTLNLAYYHNGDGGVGLFGWVNDMTVADFQDYLSRHMEVCAACGAEKDGPACACGSRKFKPAARGYEALAQDIPLSDGRVIPARAPVLDEFGQPVPGADGLPLTEPTRLPYYRITALPLVLRKNISVYGKLLGESDVDRIADMQERIKKLGTKIDEKLLKGGSYITLPHNVSFEKNDGELKVIKVRSPADTQSISVQTLEPNISYDSMELDKAVMAAKETMGISQSFQGFPDTTATSGVAKQFAARRSAGRLESKRTMKDAAWADIYQLLFQFKLAYADEPRAYAVKDQRGNKVYGKFDRYDFLKQDAAGQWYYNDAYLFSVDSSAGLASDREAMWQETRKNYQSGTFGQVGSPDSLVLFWTLMEELHYPKATEIKTLVLDQIQQASQKQAQQMAQMQMQQQAAGAEGVMPQNMQAIPAGAPREMNGNGA